MKRISFSFKRIRSFLQPTILYFLFAIKIFLVVILFVFFETIYSFVGGAYYTPYLDGQLATAHELVLMQEAKGKQHGSKLRNECLALAPYCYWHLRCPFVGIVPSGKSYYMLAHQFTLWELAPRRGEGVRVALIDTAIGPHPDLKLENSSQNNATLSVFSYCSLNAHHGTHMAGIMAGYPFWLAASLRIKEPLIGAIGIAPAMTLKGIEILKNDGIGDMQSLIEALQLAHSYKARIVNLSLRAKQLEYAIQPPFPFMVVPFTFKIQPSVAQGRFSSVICEVGALTWNGKEQYKKYADECAFAVPGTHILSAALPYNASEYMYLFMSGHSQATACMSGFLALVLGEFEHLFSDADFNSIFSYCVSGEGMLDMRLCLFILTILRYYASFYMLPHFYYREFAQELIFRNVQILLFLFDLYSKNTPLDYVPFHVQYIMPSLYSYFIYLHSFLFAKFLTHYD